MKTDEDFLFIGKYKGGKGQKWAGIHWCENTLPPAPHWSLTVYTFGDSLGWQCMRTFVDHDVLAGIDFDQLDDAIDRANGILGVAEDKGTEFSNYRVWRWKQERSDSIYGKYGWRGM